MSNAFPIFGLLKKPVYLGMFTLVFGLIFYGNYYLMRNMAGSKDNMCTLGGNFTVGNVFFAVLMSLLVGLVVIGFFENLKKRAAQKKFTVGSTSFLGLFLGMLTSFCTLCTLPVIPLFGVSIGLSFFSDYQLYIKLISLSLLIFSLVFVNRELVRGCQRCVA